jgi:hypothetical protein
MPDGTQTDSIANNLETPKRRNEMEIGRKDPDPPA